MEKVLTSNSPFACHDYCIYDAGHTCKFCERFSNTLYAKMKKFPALTPENENSLFLEVCEKCEHNEIVMVGDRFFQIFFGPEHDSWTEIEP